MKHKSAFPMAFALAESKLRSPVGAAVPSKPKIFCARTPTIGAAHAAIAPSKHLYRNAMLNTDIDAFTAMQAPLLMLQGPEIWHCTPNYLQKSAWDHLFTMLKDHVLQPCLWIVIHQLWHMTLWWRCAKSFIQAFLLRAVHFERIWPVKRID